jgi:phosphohistidine phosphatase
MKTLLLMRHAKATWDHDQWPDFERPLNPTGEADAQRMGRRMIQADLKPDAIICSSARRTMQTAELVAEELGIPHLIQSRADLYLCPVSVWEDLIHRLPPDLNCVLCVGHNNGLEDLVSYLLKKRHSFPTAALARVTLHEWAGFDRSTRPSHIEVWVPE